MTMGRIIAAADPDALRLAAETIRGGGLVAFPTETVYGLGADALNAEAVAKLFEAKQRPYFDPLIVHVADEEAVTRVAHSIGAAERQLMRRFWPGPLTLILRKQAIVPDLVTAGLPTVAVRMPDHPVAQALIRQAGTPIAAPSANPFGYVSPTTAMHVLEGLGEQVNLILDGGPCSLGLESTIVSLRDDNPAVLRPGSLAVGDLEEELGSTVQCRRRDGTPYTPGQFPRHYATRTPLTILPVQKAIPPIEREERVGLLAWSSPANVARFSAVEVLSSSGDMREAARKLFGALRQLDALALDRLYAEPCEERGLGVAIMDRLRRCAVPFDAPTPRRP